jgi:flavin reductase (DIM6/NTAB) family NADH-FMN oxidoreductase RutF
MTDLSPSAGPEEAGEPQDDLRAFRRALGNFATGVTIVSATHGSRNVGVTANSFSSVSLDPPLVLWSIDRKSTSLDAFLNASHFAINILSESQTELSNKFSRTSEEKYVGVDWTAGQGGAPLLAGAVAHLECSREIEYDGGDHVIMIGRVEKYTRYDREPLVFARGRYVTAIERPEPEKPRDATGPNSDSLEKATLLQSLLRAYEGISDKFDAHRQAAGLSLNQSRVLALLTRGPAGSIPAIIRGALLGQAAAEDAVASLMERGLAQMDSDGKYEITPAGLNLSIRLRDELHRLENSVAADASGLDIESARMWLASLAMAAQAPLA